MVVHGSESVPTVDNLDNSAGRVAPPQQTFAAAAIWKSARPRRREFS